MVKISRVELTDTTVNEWNDLVDICGGTFYHRTGWLRALEVKSAYNPWHLVARKNGSVIGVWPNFVTTIPVLGFERLHSIPSGFGGPLISTDREETFQAFLAYIDEHRPSWWAEHLVTLGCRDVGFTQLYREAGYALSMDRCGALANVATGFEEYLESVSKDRRYEIRKARDEETNIESAPVAGRPLQAFYDVYTTAMDRHDATPHERAFFERLGETCPETARLWLCYDETDAPIGGLVTLYSEATGTVHNHFAGADPEHFSRYPMQRLHAAAIEAAIDEGHDTYDFGATVPDFREGLFDYKSQYATDVEPYLNWRRNLSRPRGTLASAARAIEPYVDRVRGGE